MTAAHTEILRIARAGNPARAMRLFEEQGFGAVADDPGLLTLKGRLLKDRARASQGAARMSDYAEASRAYRAAFVLEPDTYPLINAATLALLGDDAVEARGLARKVLRMIDSDPDEGETPYWREATRAEALLLLGKRDESEAALKRAVDELPLAHEDLAATVGQFERVLAHQGKDAAWLDRFRPPPSLHFSGLIGLDPDEKVLLDTIEQSIERLRPGYAFGALAAGADILIAEGAIRSGAQLHVTLPLSVDEFRARSVEPFGDEWGARFDELASAAESVEVAPSPEYDSGHAFATAIDFASFAAMGRCLHHARILRSRAHALSILAPGERDRSYVAAWENSGSALERIEAPRKKDGASSRSGQVEAKETIFGLVQLPGVDPETVTREGLGTSLHRLEIAEDTVLVAPVEHCVGFARTWLEEQPNAAIAIAAGITEHGRPPRELLERLAILARHVEPGAVLADRHTAMVARLLDPAIRIEEVGELASLSGQVPLWSIAP